MIATERQQLLLARIGQGKFRDVLLQRWKSACSVLGCGPETALVASHIVAWKNCLTNEGRLDPNNGLLLSPNLDKLFDRKLISFADNGALLVSLRLNQADALALGASQLAASIGARGNRKVFDSPSGKR